MRDKSNYISKKFKKILVNILIFLLKLLIFLKRLATAFFVNFIFGLVRLILRFIFYNVVVKFYKLYLWLLHKAGQSGLKRKSLIVLINQRAVHLAMILFVVILVYSNLATKSKGADFVSASEGETILASLIKSEFETAEEEQLIEELFDEEAIISSAQQSYLDNLSAVKMELMAQPPSLNEETLENLGVISPGGGALIKPEIVATKKVQKPRTEIVYYTVEAGDTVSTIAAKFDISVNTILWENNLSAYSIIRPGDILTVLPVSGITHKVAKGESLGSIAKRYGAPEEKILEVNKITDASKLVIGQKLIVPGGSKTSYAAAQSKGYSGFNVLRDLVETDLLKPSGAKPVAGNKMNWPTVGYRITQYFSWRHHALDIANKAGTPVYAADTGTVEYAGWGKGYGNQIVIDHGGGKKTRYAHLSKLYTKKGDKVEKGETIGAMGSTGRSTGSHLHFEVIIYGIKYNPLNYVR